MKPVMAWLFSVLLVVVQSVTASGSDAPQTSPKCNRCACGRACCVSPSSPASNPLPAREGNLPSAKQLQPALALSIQPLHQSCFYAEDAPLPAAFSFRPGVVPIYDWNCSYLL